MQFRSDDQALPDSSLLPPHVSAAMSPASDLDFRASDDVERLTRIVVARRAGEAIDPADVDFLIDAAVLAVVAHPVADGNPTASSPTPPRSTRPWSPISPVAA